MLALAWLLHQDGVSSAIVGPADRQQFETALQAVALHLDGTTLDRLDALFPLRDGGLRLMPGEARLIPAPCRFSITSQRERAHV